MSFVGVAVAGAVVSAGSSIAGGVMKAKAAKRGEEAQLTAARESNALQERMYNQQRADQQPWRDAGTKALTGMQDADYSRDFTADDFQEDPGYAFRMAEGQKALERSAAAKGGLQSGGTLKAAARYSQDVASNEYNNAYTRFNADRDRRFGRLSSLAGIGQNATNAVGNATTNYTNAVGTTLMDMGNTRAAAEMGRADAIGGGMAGVGSAITGMGNNWMTLSSMNKKKAAPTTAALPVE